MTIAGRAHRGAGFLLVTALAVASAACAGGEASKNLTVLQPLRDLSASHRNERVGVYTFTTTWKGAFGIEPDVEEISDAFASALGRSGAFDAVERIAASLDPDVLKDGAPDCRGYDVVMLGRVTKHDSYADGLPGVRSYGHGILAAQVVLFDCATGSVRYEIPDLYARFEDDWTTDGALLDGAVELGSRVLVERVGEAITARTAARTPPRSPSSHAPDLEPGRIAPAPRAPRRPGARDPYYDRRVAVVIGIDHYDYWPPLEGAARDARRMAELFEEMGFDEVMELYDADATRERILDLLGRRLPAEVTPESLAVIFFAGHGQTETLARGLKQGYVIPVDADVERVFASAISMEVLRSLSNRLPAKHVYYAMDSCYSGLGFQRGIALTKRGAPGYLEKLTSRRAVQMVTAGGEGEEAIEVGGQGVFTATLIDGFRGEADLDGDGVVTASELGTYVVPEVSARSRDRQTPRFGTLEGTGEVVFVLP